MAGERDAGAWDEMRQLLQSGKLSEFWSRYRMYLIANGVVSERRALLVASIQETVRKLERPTAVRSCSQMISGEA